MSHGSEYSPNRGNLPLLAQRDRLRFLALAIGAVLTWVCLDTSFSLVFPEYHPLGFQSYQPSTLSFVIGLALAATAIGISLLLTGLSESRYVIFYVLAGSLTLAAATQLDFGFISSATLDTLRNVASAIVTTFALVATAATFASAVPEDLTAQLQLRLPERRHILAFALPIAAWLALIFVWQFTPFNPVIHPEAPDSVANIHAAFGINPFLTIAYITLLIPIAEEVLFRGLIVPYLTKVTGAIHAIIWSALMFAIFHIDPQYFSINQVLFISCLGIVLAIAVATTRSIWPGIAVHAINNALVSIQSI